MLHLLRLYLLRLFTGFAIFLTPAMLVANDVKLFETSLIDLQFVDGEIIGRDKNGQTYALSIENNDLTLNTNTLPNYTYDNIDILPDGEIAQSLGTIRRAWLGGVTKRYDHGVLGDAMEASRLYIVDENNQQHVVELPPLQVFEDRYPRLADINNDSDAEAVVIRTDVNTGAAIASYGIKNNKLTLYAVSKSIGLSHRWLNIIGVADFDGDGQTEIAAVVTPHIGGTLTLYRQSGQELQVVLEKHGFSNHKYGSRELRLSATYDFNNDGVMDIAVPNTNRRSLVLLTLKGGIYGELTRIENPSEIKSGVYIFDIDKDDTTELVYLLDDKSLAVVRADIH